MKPKPTKGLEAVLAYAQSLYNRVLEDIKKLPPEQINEQVRLLDLEGNLRDEIEALKGQIAARK